MDFFISQNSNNKNLMSKVTLQEMWRIVQRLMNLMAGLLIRERLVWSIELKLCCIGVGVCVLCHGPVSHQLRKPAFHSRVLQRSDCAVFTQPYLVKTTCAATPQAQEIICFRLEPVPKPVSYAEEVQWVLGEIWTHFGQKKFIVLMLDLMILLKIVNLRRPC